MGNLNQGNIQAQLNAKLDMLGSGASSSINQSGSDHLMTTEKYKQLQQKYSELYPDHMQNQNEVVFQTNENASMSGASNGDS